MLIREDANYDELSAEEMQACIEKHYRWVETLQEKGQFKEALEEAIEIAKGNPDLDWERATTKMAVTAPVNVSFLYDKPSSTGIRSAARAVTYWSCTPPDKWLCHQTHYTTYRISP